MKITQLFSYALLGVFSLVMCLPSESNAMWKKTTTTEEWGFGGPPHTTHHNPSPKELIDTTHRVQLFSLAKAQGKTAAHTLLETMRSKEPSIATHTALIAIEAKSKWIRGQIVMPSQASAADMQTKLRKIFTKDQPTVSEPGVVHQKGFGLEEAEVHTWK